MQEPLETSLAITSTPRRDLYGAVHKGLRAHMAHALVIAGSADPHDERAVSEVRDTVTQLIALSAQHLHEEDLFIEAAIDRRSSRGGATTRDEHRDHLAALQGITALLQREPAGPQPRGPWLEALYSALGRFVAESLAHMDREERENNALLWSAYDDAELEAIEGALVAQIPPAAMGGFVAWMLPAMRHHERVALLREMRAGAPPEVVAGVLAIADARLSDEDARALRDSFSA
jgi:hypothetical protein